MGPARTGPTPKTPKRRLTGSKPGEVNARDVGWSLLESLGWTGIPTGISALGYELRDSLPLIALSFPLEIVLIVAITAFVLIFAAKLWNRKRADNRPRR